MKNIKNFPEIDLVILAGGKGSRIKNKIKDLPKPMVKISDKPFLDYLLNIYCSYPFNKIYIMCGYRSSKIIKRYHGKIINFVEIECITENKPLGTGGCLKLLLKKISKHFVLVNGDTYFDIDYSFFFKKNIQNKNIISLVKNKNYKSNTKLINLDLKNKKIIFKKKSTFINGGVYFLNAKILNSLKRIKKNNFSFEIDFLNDQINKKLMYGKKYNNFFIDIGTVENLSFAKQRLKKITTKPGVFLDRDGVINIDNNYVYRISDFDFNKGIINFLKKITKKFYIFIITNQAGIAHGKYKLQDFFKLQRNIKKYFFLKNILINDVQYCPYHPKAKIMRYRKISKFRKPGNLMIESILKKWNIEKNKSFMIGDQKIDEICAKKSNIKFYYYKKIKL